MATKKQVRRRLKERRHEWEEVYVDAAGNVVDPPPDEPEPTTARAAKREPAKQGRRQTGRTVQPPSWQRVLKRGLIFAPLMYLTVALLAPDRATLRDNIFQTVFLLMVFLPFSYAMDTLTYRLWRRRTGQADAREKSP